MTGYARRARHLRSAPHHFRSLHLALLPLIALAGLCLRAHALPPLPDDFINDDLFLMVVVDLTQTTPGAIDATGRGILENLPEGGDVIAKIRADHEAFYTAGARFLVIAVAETESADLDAFMPMAGVFLDADTCDEPALRDIIARHAGEVSPDPVIERQGDWLLVWKSDRRRLTNRKEDGPLLEIPNIDPARADRVRAGFGSLQGRAVGMFTMPTAQMHKDAEEGMGDWAPEDPESPENIPFLLSASVSAHGWIDLGHNPSITAVVEMPDPTRAGHLTAALGALPKMMQEQMQYLEGMAEEDLAEFAPEMKLTMKVMTSIHSVQQGTNVTISIGQADLRAILDMAAPVLAKQQEQAKEWEAAENPRQLGMAVITYASAHENKWPDSLDQLVSSGQMTQEELDDLLINKATGEKNACKYVKPDRSMGDLENPWMTPMIYQLKNGQVDKEGFIVYADGHAQKGEMDF